MDELLTQFGISGPKFLAQVILFLVVYAILKKFAFGPIIAIFEERRQTIAESQSNAEKIKKQLAEAEIRYQEILCKANAKAQHLIDEARAASEATAQKHLQQAVKDAENILSKARESIDLERVRMVADVKNEMIHLVAETTALVTGKVLTEADQNRLAEETTKQLAA